MLLVLTSLRLYHFLHCPMARAVVGVIIMHLVVGPVLEPGDQAVAAVLRTALHISSGGSRWHSAAGLRGPVAGMNFVWLRAVCMESGYLGCSQYN